MKILLVIDAQNDFVTGTLSNPEAQAKISILKEKIEKRKAEGWLVMFTQDTHWDETYMTSTEGRYLPVKHCIRNTWGWQIVDELQPYAKTTISITKTRFGEPNLYNYIMQWIGETNICLMDEIELVGFCTDICVISNAIILKSLVHGIVISCDSACCAGTSIEAHEAALTVMKSCHIEVH